MLKDTKQKGDIAEALVIAKLLRQGYAIAQPFGDRMPYDLLVDMGDGLFARIQVKGLFTHWSSAKTYKRRMYAKGIEDRYYPPNSYDFMIVYYGLTDSFYVVPAKFFDDKRSFSVPKGKQRDGYAASYHEAWHLLAEWATERAISLKTSVKLGEAPGTVIPSQALFREGVETKWQTSHADEDIVQTTKQPEVVQ